MSQALSKHHKKAYGAWAGRPGGEQPDPERCAEEVHYNIGRAGMFKQCDRKRGYGPDGAFCKQHSPDAKAARAKAQNDKYQAEMLASNEKWYRNCWAMKLDAALRKIAAGDNDPRSTALEIIKAADKWREEYSLPTLESKPS